MPVRPPTLRLPIVPGRPWLLDLFCCAGGAGVGYYRAGFNVVGVDIAPQPRYPFTFVQADALDVLRGQIANLGIRSFAAIHASPPCQHYSNAQRIRDNAHPDLIAPTRELLDGIGLPYVVENVEGARDHMLDAVRLCGAMFPELRVYRHRLFESNIDLTVPAHGKHTHKQTKMGRTPVEGEFVHVVGNFSGVEYAREAMGISWMSRDQLKEAIPPAYTEYLGSQIITHIRKENTMSDTHRAHLPSDRHSARAHTRRKMRTMAERGHKSAKANRKHERDALRKMRQEFER